ncbi:hypothetical protein VitviT2T_004066 [Vitis vinifera]|uniref:Uncharacterized protein n=1 Tax=Vitis vinifera TaxID=29760 RepID=A0ABY9BND4_VITVI|nr:hypothetical protein VitviT2T_004066 [Vitis vinifera]
MAAVKYLNGMAAEQISNGMAAEQILDVIHPGGMAARSPIQICFLDEKDPHSAASGRPVPDDSISYPDNFSLLCHGFQRPLLNLGLLW